MNTFFRRTGVKITGAILCILSLTITMVSGLLVLVMLSAGVYDGDRDLYKNMTQNMIASDAHSIMTEYFDPSDPTHPWSSYFDGPIYTGEKSNLLYTITDEDSGKTVLSTYDGQESQFSQSCTYSFDEETTVETQDRFQVKSSLIFCDDSYYVYDGDQYFNSLNLPAAALDSAETLDSDALEDGFSYEGSHYSYDGSAFYLDTSWENTTVSWSTHSYTITCYLLQDLTYPDMYRDLYWLTNTMMDLRYWCIVIFSAAALLSLILLILLGRTVGRVNGQDAPVLSPLFHVPADLGLVLCLFLGALCLEMTVEFHESAYLSAMFTFDTLMLLGLAAIFVYGILLLCVRGKTHTLITGSVIFWCLKLLGRFLRWIANAAKKALNYLPLLWKVLVCYCLLCLVELICIVSFTWSSGDFIFLWFLEKLLLGALVAYVTLCFRRLKIGAEQIAAGNYSAKVNPKNLVLDFKDTAETLNHIQDGMSAAVDSRIKSERLKTELITNVSHDLKTPLTSIVSYVDLLKQEPAGSEAAKEYLAVLDRQSMRLKKLIEDLVEASKASTGNLNLQLESLDFSMLLGQALGEYSQRLTTADLTPVLKIPETPVMIQADGQRLWRVFDNLLGNVVKYAMPGTRFYLTVEADDTVTATFRNISREQLDVSAEDLMERFVRGDASRHTEGSGLGLSIARSLTESMGGQFALQVDGDLFKAMVTFPVILQTQEPPSENN